MQCCEKSTLTMMGNPNDDDSDSNDKNNLDHDYITISKDIKKETNVSGSSTSKAAEDLVRIDTTKVR